ncbi:MAG TPA: lysophospholipid acyltransferase family protein, partial [Acidobacteriota bacterium]|nr:lysophospholipid acyltransferase family protein [Acidobacteriota bacterium]
MKLRYHLERILFSGVLLAARILPHAFFLSLGRWFGRFARHVDGRHRRVAMDNLATAFPEMREAERREILRRCYAFFGMYLFDLLTCFPKFRGDRMKDFEYEGLENVEEGYRLKKGVIFYTGHWGAWEMMGMAHGFKGYPLGVIARRLDNPYLQHLLETLRCSTGNFVIDKKEGFRPMLKALKEGKGIAILIDQNVTTEDRVFVDFFGRSASTTPVIGLLELKTEAALIAVFALPLPGGGYRFSYSRPLEVPLTGDRKVDALRITQECTRVIED